MTLSKVLFWKSTVVSVLLVCLLLPAMPAFAMSGDEDDLFSMSLEELLNMQISVASKTDESLADAPSSVTAFTQEDIARMGFRTVEDILNHVPGFQATRDVEQGTATRIASRGRGSALSESVLFLLDGQRLNDLYTGGVSILNRLIAVENIKSIEIIRGPGSALYGSNAFLGVVNIKTKQTENSVQAGVGDYGYSNMAVNVHHRLGPKVQLTGFVKATASNGYEYNGVTDVFGRTRSTQDPYSGADLYLKLDVHGLRVNFRHMERSLRDFMTFGAISNHNNREAMEQTSVRGEYDLKPNDALGIQLSASYSQDKWQTVSELIPAGLEIAPGFALNSAFNGGPYLESNHIGAYADGSYQLTDDNLLLAGVSFEQTGITDVRNVMTHNPITLNYRGRLVNFDGNLSFNEETTRQILGVYVQDKQDIGDDITLTAGFRLDNYDDFGSSFNPRAALVYRTPLTSSVKVMYGHAFRAPNFLELYDRNNPVDFGNPDLDAEKVRTFEVAYIQNLSKLHAGVTYFRNEIEDLIVLGPPVTDPDNPLGSPTFVNGGDITTEGLEFEAKAQVTDDFFLSATLTSLFDADNLPVPGLTASFAANYAIQKFNVNLNGIYRDQMDAVVDQDAYMVLNSTMRYAIGAKSHVRFSVYNLADEEYYTVSSVLPGGVINSGRTMLVGYALSW